MDFYVALFTSLVVLAVGLELRHNYGSSELDASDTRATQQFRAFRCARMTACKGNTTWHIPAMHTPTRAHMGADRACVLPQEQLSGGVQPDDGGGLAARPLHLREAGPLRPDSPLFDQCHLAERACVVILSSCTWDACMWIWGLANIGA